MWWLLVAGVACLTFENVTTFVDADTFRSTFSWQGNSSAYVVDTWIQNPEILSEARLSIPVTGVVPSQSSPIDVDFHCQDVGESVVIHSFLVNETLEVVGYIKDCVPNSCAEYGKCQNGTCQGSRCICAPGFVDRWCNLYLTTDVSQVCPGEAVQVTWDHSPNVTDADYTPSWLDFILLVRLPNTELSDVTADTVYASSLDGYQLSTFYLGLNDQPPVDPVRAGKITFQPIVPGVYGVGYCVNDNPKPLQVRGFEVLPKENPKCSLSPEILSSQTQLPESEQCNGAGNFTTAPNGVRYCSCRDNKYGPACEYGCSDLTTLTTVGNDFASSSNNDPPLYHGSTNCTWLLEPSLDSITAIQITFKFFVIADLQDSVGVYKWENSKWIPHTSLQGTLVTPFDITVPGPKALVAFVSTPQRLAVMNTSRQGWRASYLAIGCLPGNILEPRNNSSVTDCSPAPAGFFSSEVNTLVALPCSPQTYSLAGASQCSSCPLDMFQDEAGQSACKICREHGYPSPCRGPPYWSSTSRIVAYVFAGLVGSCLLLTVTLLLYYRRTKVAFSFRPALVLVLLSGLALLVLFCVLLVPEATVRLCSAQVWLANSGIVLVLAILLGRAMRIYLVFVPRQLSTIVALSDGILVIFAGCWFLLESIYVLILLLLSPPLIRSALYSVCEYPKPWAYAGLVLSKGLIVMLLLYVALRARQHITYRFRKFFYETQLTLLALLTAAVVLGLITPLALKYKDPRTRIGLVFVGSLILVFSTWTFTCMPFVVLIVKRKFDDETSALWTTEKSKGSSNKGSDKEKEREREREKDKDKDKERGSETHPSASASTHSKEHPAHHKKLSKDELKKRLQKVNEEIQALSKRIASAQHELDETNELMLKQKNIISVCQEELDYLNEINED